MINPHSKKHNRAEPSVGNNLRAIYTQNDGTVTDMRHITRRQKTKFRRFLLHGIFLLCAVSALAWSGFFVFSKGMFQKSSSLHVQIDGPDQVTSGELVTYTIRYENIGSVPLAALELSASVPLDFHITSVVPEANEKNTWTIGSLAPKSDGAITVRGRFQAEVPSTEKWQTLITYKPANFNSSFQKIETKQIQINASIFEITATGPQSASVGDPVDYVITVSQNQTEPAQHLRVVPTVPQTFTIQKTEPIFENGQAFWNIDTLDPNQPKSFTIHGVFSASALEDQTVGAHVGFMVDDTYIKQKTAEVKTVIQHNGLSFHLVVNGSNADQRIDAGSPLKGSIDFTNQTQETIKNISFALALDGTGELPIDWEHADLKNGTRNGNQILWNASANNALSALKPNASGTIDFILPTQIRVKTADHFLLTLSAHTTQDASGTNTSSTTPITISLNSEIKFRSYARYFTEDGIPIGTGPLPPTVGKTTTYRVFWNITNALHDLSGVAVTTSIPANVMWLNKSGTDIGTITYKKDVITWTIPKLPTSIPNVGAWFDVSVKPAATDVDTSMPLAGSSTMNAKDAFTSQPIAKTTDALTTNLVTDEFANGKGVVKK